VRTDFNAMADIFEGMGIEIYIADDTNDGDSTIEVASQISYGDTLLFVFDNKGKLIKAL
jgi:hypothetical protein